MVGQRGRRKGFGKQPAMLCTQRTLRVCTGGGYAVSCSSDVRAAGTPLRMLSEMSVYLGRQPVDTSGARMRRWAWRTGTLLTVRRIGRWLPILPPHSKMTVFFSVTILSFKRDFVGLTWLCSHASFAMPLNERCSEWHTLRQEPKTCSEIISLASLQMAPPSSRQQAPADRSYKVRPSPFLFYEAGFIVFL